MKLFALSKTELHLVEMHAVDVEQIASVRSERPATHGTIIEHSHLILHTAMRPDGGPYKYHTHEEKSCEQADPY